MKRWTIVTTFLLGLVVLANLGCGGSPSVEPEEEFTNEGPCPSWYVNPPTDENFLYAASTATSQDLQMAVDKARTSGRLLLASQIETHIQGLTAQFSEEVGLAEESKLLAKTSVAVKAVVDHTLRGSRAAKTSQMKEGNVWRACVLMETPVADAESNLMRTISKDEEMYTRFRESQTFQMMEHEIDKQREYEAGR
jgi:hypothetical protein